MNLTVNKPLFCALLFLVGTTSIVWCQSEKSTPLQSQATAKDQGVAGVKSDTKQSNSNASNKVSQLTLDSLRKRTSDDAVFDDDAMLALFDMDIAPAQGVSLFRDFLNRWLTATSQKKPINPRYAWTAFNSVVTLGRYGPSAKTALPDLITLLRTEKSWPLIRREAFDAALRIAPDDARFLSVLVESLGNDDTEDVQIAASVLGEKGEVAQSAIPALVALLDVELRKDKSVYAYSALGKITRQRYNFTLKEALARLNHIESVPPEEGAAAFETIIQSGDSSAATAQTLAKLLSKQRKPYLIYSAISAIERSKLGSQPEILRLLLRWSRPSADETTGFASRLALQVAADSVSPTTTQAIPTLISSLESSDLEERHNAAIVLGMMKEAASPTVPLLVELLKTEMKQEQYLGINSYTMALLNIGAGASSATPAIFDMMKPDSPYLRGDFGARDFAPYWLGILSRIGFPTEKAERQFVVATILEGLKSTDPEPLQSAARAAGMLATEAKLLTPALITVLKSGEKEGGLRDTSHDPHQGHAMHAWNWQDPEIIDSFEAVVHSLVELKDASEATHSILAIYNEMPDAAPLSRLKPQIKNALARITNNTANANNGAVDKFTKSDVQGKSAIDKPVTNLKLTTKEGNVSWLRDEGRRGTAFFFADTSCPCVVAYMDRVRNFQQSCTKDNIDVFVVFSGEDSVPKVDQFLAKNNLSGNIIIDKEQKLFEYFNVRRTAQTAFVDSNGLLRYNGRFDDNIYEPAEVKEHDLTNAIADVLSGREVSQKGILPSSCPIN